MLTLNQLTMIFLNQTIVSQVIIMPIKEKRNKIWNESDYVTKIDDKFLSSLTYFHKVVQQMDHIWKGDRLESCRQRRE